MTSLMTRDSTSTDDILQMSETTDNVTDIVAFGNSFGSCMNGCMNENLEVECRF